MERFALGHSNYPPNSLTLTFSSAPNNFPTRATVIARTFTAASGNSPSTRRNVALGMRKTLTSCKALAVAFRKTSATNAVSPISAPRPDAPLFLLCLQDDLAVEHQKCAVGVVAFAKQLLARLENPLLAGEGQQLQGLARQQMERRRARHPLDVGFQAHCAPPQGKSL